MQQYLQLMRARIEASQQQPGHERTPAYMKLVAESTVRLPAYKEDILLPYILRLSGLRTGGHSERQRGTQAIREPERALDEEQQLPVVGKRPAEQAGRAGDWLEEQERTARARFKKRVVDEVRQIPLNIAKPTGSSNTSILQAPPALKKQSRHKFTLLNSAPTPECKQNFIPNTLMCYVDRRRVRKSLETRPQTLPEPTRLKLNQLMQMSRTQSTRCLGITTRM